MRPLIAVIGLVSGILLAACGSDSSSMTTVVEKTTTVTQTETVEATTSAPPKNYEFFQSPSKNIGCAAVNEDVVQVRCDIRSHDWKSPAKPADCELDYGGGLVIQA